MLKLVCPKCQLNLRVPEQRVPAAGAWAQCPRCRERFFINPAGSSLEDLTRPFANGDSGSAAPRRGASARDSSSQRLLDRLKAKRGQPEEPGYEPGQVIVYPEPALPGSVYQAASVVMLCLPLLAVFFLFSSANTRLNRPAAPPPAPVSTAVERLNDQENPELIRKDLVSIKRDHLMRRRNLYGMGYSGPESRVFNYFMNRLAPGVCDGVHYLQVSVPMGGVSGFSMTGLCLAPEGRRLEMRVKWSDQGGRISFPYNQRFEDFSLRPGV